MTPPADVNPQKARTGLSRVWHATGYSLEGLRAGWGETAFRQEAIARRRAAARFVLAGSQLGGGGAAGRLGAAGDDRGAAQHRHRNGHRPHRPEWHDLSKRAKDMGSAAVLLSLLLCIGIWVAALWHRFVHDTRLLRSACTAARAPAQRARPSPGSRRGRDWIGRHGGQLVYGGGNNGLMGVVADATLAGRRPRGGRDPASAGRARAGQDRLHRAARGGHHARAQAPDGRARRRLPGAAGRHRHVGGTVRGLDLAPAGLPRQADRPAQRGGLLRQPAGLPGHQRAPRLHERLADGPAARRQRARRALLPALVQAAGLSRRPRLSAI
jgi:diacylglycerol kinase (ATP)